MIGTAQGGSKDIDLEARIYRYIRDAMEPVREWELTTKFGKPGVTGFGHPDVYEFQALHRGVRVTYFDLLPPVREPVRIRRNRKRGEPLIAHPVTHGLGVLPY